MFDNHFEVFLADTLKAKNIHYSIRYQVYCEEMGFEKKEEFPLKKEFDADDERSIHFIVRNKETGQWVGAMRLIHRLDSLLPIEKNSNIDEEIDCNGTAGTTEMSRLCILKEVRRGVKDIDPPNGISVQSQSDLENNKVKLLSKNKMNRLIIWGLFRAAATYCKNNSMKYCYFMTTAILAKVLRRGGLDLVNIGRPCQHKGERHPFKLDAIETFYSNIWGNDFNNDYRLFSELTEQHFSEFQSVA